MDILSWIYFNISREQHKGGMNFKSSRNFIVYDEEEEVVRFAMTSEIEPPETIEDPCRGYGAPSCPANSYCMNINSVAKCLCNQGFQEDPNNVNNCIDVDECTTSAVHCDRRMENSECVNTIGSYKCVCKANYMQRGGECIMVSEHIF